MSRWNSGTSDHNQRRKTSVAVRYFYQAGVWTSPIAFLLVLAACATPYAPANKGRGYIDSQVATNEFQVGFQGNCNTDADQVRDFALLRSAELTLEHGYLYFAVLDVTNTSSAKSYIARQRYVANNPFGWGPEPPVPGYYSSFQPAYLFDVEEPRVYFQQGTSLRIKCFAGKPDRPFTYEASSLQQSLRQKYKLRS
jgi:hypothetical protein